MPFGEMVTVNAFDKTKWAAPSRRAYQKVLLVDDHTMVRESLLLLLDTRLPGHRWRDGATLASALSLLHNEPDIDLLLLDLDLPDSRGTATLARVREAAPQVPVVVLSAHDDRDHVLAAIDRGAAGFISKCANAEHLVEAVRRVMDGGVSLPAGVLPGRSSAVGTPGGQPDFSERQGDVLRLLIEGHSNKLIARRLGLSDATVKTHLQAVYRKLEVESRTQAVLAVARWGLRL